MDPKGPEGIGLVSAMVRADSFGRNVRVMDTMVERRYGRTHHSGNIKQLQLLMNSWADGMADEAISHEVHNGPCAWRELCRQQLSEIAHQ